MDADLAAPYQRLMKLVEQELDALRSGRLEDFHRSVVETGAYMRTLPSPAPAVALPLIHRAVGMRAHIQSEAKRAQEQASRSLVALRQKRQIRRKYAAPRPSRYTTSA